MKSPRYIPYLIVALALILTACSKATPDESIALTRQAIEAEDYASAQRLLDEATSTADNQSINAEDLLQYAVLYRQLSEHCNEGENVAAAFNCYSRAVEIAPDSIAFIIAAMPTEYKQTLLELSHLNIGADVSDFEEEMPQTIE